MDTVYKPISLSSYRALRDSGAFRVALVAFAAVVILFREIDLILHPRLWAEEGQVFYFYARHHSLWQIFSTPQVGYLTLFNSIVSALQAKVFRVEQAAAVTTCAGFLVQILSIGALALTSHPFWSTPVRKAVCVAAIVFLMPAELWLNTTNSHFTFGLITFVIMAAPAEGYSRGKRWTFRALIVLGTLTGPASMLLAPAFLYKAYRSPCREKRIQAAMHLVCATLQAAVIVQSLLFNNKYKRLEGGDWSLSWFMFFVDHFSLSFDAFGIVPAFVLAVGVAVYVTYLIVRCWKNEEHRLFLVSFVIVAAFSTLGSLHMLGSPRYGYLPTCILMFVLVGEAFGIRAGQTRLEQLLGSGLLAVALVVNVGMYKTRFEQLPSGYYAWRAEVKHWRANPSYRPRIWPIPWSMEL